MIIDCISDLHGYYPKLKGGDLLIIAGDLLANDEPESYEHFFDWLSEQPYRKKIFIGGNHDNLLDGCLPQRYESPVHKTNQSIELFEYLCDSGTEFENLKIWGSPWTLHSFDMAFTCNTEKELSKKWEMIPEGLDV